MIGWQWHQLNHMQIICTSLQTDNHVSTPTTQFCTSRMPFLLPNRQCQSTEGINVITKLYNNTDPPEQWRLTPMIV